MIFFRISRLKRSPCLQTRKTSGRKDPHYENILPLAPSKGGHMKRFQTVPYNWIPAFAGMTKGSEPEGSYHEPLLKHVTPKTFSL